jgi:hypothetical protein
MHMGKYVAAFRLVLEDGVTLERYRSSRGGLHKMRLFHHKTGLFVEREFDGSEPVLAVQNDLIGRLRATLSEIGIRWLPARDRDKGTA